MALERAFGIVPSQLLVLLVCVISLSMLPIYKVGTYNDLVMRTSIPSLFILWAMVGKILVDSSQHIQQRLGRIYGLLLVVFGLGSYSSMSEIARSIERYSWQPPAISTVATTSTLNKEDFFKLQRMGNPQAPFFRYLGK